MDKFIKINSVQGGDFTTAQNLIDFVIPSSMGVVNLRDSYINLNVKVNVSESNTDGGGVGVYCAGVQWKKGSNTKNPHFTNTAIVKNCNLRSAQKGQIENIRRIDQLSQVMATYTRSFEEEQSYSYLKANQVVGNVDKQHWTLYREINKTGSVISRDLDICPVQISLADLMDFCRSARECDLSKTGDLRLHLELNVDKLQPVQRMTVSADLVDFDELVAMKEITAEGDANQVVTNTKFTDGLGLSPFYVGQKVVITATHTDGGASNVNETRIISNISQSTSTSELSINFNSSWGSLASGKTYTDIDVKPAEFDVAKSSLEINLAEIVLKRVGNPVGVDQIDYETFSTEQTNGLSQTSFQNLYQCEADATNVLIAFPDAETDIISSNNDINSFRIRINNEDATDREVTVDDPLYYDRLNMTFGSMGYRLKNLTQNYGNSTTNDYGSVYDDAETKTVVIANPLFQTEREKQLQVNIEAGGGGVKKLTLFKQRPRTMVF
tara:strand:- start:8204 stop:9691 length:1488 start_codon:yes stop_codon:yes gene_type:complete